MKVLIIEDHPPMRLLIRSLLAGLADEVSECDDGGLAVARYAAERPDWVLMDIELPHLNGLAAARQIKAGFAEAKILIVTNYDDQALRAEARAAGASGYVLKENLLELRKWLR
jgi:CheY-like chemotaxis protein